MDSISVSVISDKTQQTIKDMAEEDGSLNIPGTDDGEVSGSEKFIVSECKQELAKLQAEYAGTDGALYKKFTSVRRDYTDVKLKYDQKMKDRGGLPTIRHMGLWVFITLNILLFLCDVPLNYAVFQALGTEVDLVSAVLAFALALFVALMAHALGSRLKHNGDRWDRFAFLIVGLTATLIAVLAVLRVEYMAGIDTEGMFSLGKVDPAMVGALFVMMNLLLFITGAKLGYDATEADPDFPIIRREFAKRQAEAGALEVARVKNYAQFQQRRATLVGLYRTQIETYRRINLNKRPNKATPKAWIKHPVEALITDELHSIALNDNEVDHETEYHGLMKC